MAVQFQVTCVARRATRKVFERISHIGGNGWRMTEEEVIDCIESGQQAFYIFHPNAPIWLVVGVCDGRQYLKGKNDGLRPDQLLALPQCSMLHVGGLLHRTDE
jgi:Protein of unknown function (DUF3892)